MARKSRLGAVRLSNRKKKIHKLFDKESVRSELRTGYNAAARRRTLAVEVKVARTRSVYSGDAGYTATACFKGTGMSARRASSNYFRTTVGPGRGQGGGHYCGYSWKTQKTPTAAVKAALADLAKKTK